MILFVLGILAYAVIVCFGMVYINVSDNRYPFTGRPRNDP